MIGNTEGPSNPTLQPASPYGSNNLSFIVLGVVIVGIVFGAGGYLLGKNQTGSKYQGTGQISPEISITQPQSTPSPTTEETNSSQLTSASPTPTNPNAKVYTAQNLGISFTYLTKTSDSNNSPVEVKEIGNKIYVHPVTNYSSKYTDGQWVEVFTKDKSVSLEEAIKKEFLTKYSPTDCLVKSSKPILSYKTAIIDVPHSDDEDLSVLSEKWAKCPETYTTQNGLSYFLEDPQHQDKFLYFSIGQYVIESGGENIPWQDTVKFL